MNTKTRRLKAGRKIIGKCLNCSKQISKDNSFPNLLDSAPNWSSAVCVDCIKTYAWVRHLILKIKEWTNGNQVL